MIIKCLTFFMFFFPLLGYCADNEAGFAVKKSGHFIVKYKVDNHFAADVIKRAEKYYYSIENDLGLSRFSGFWTWENRCIIMIYASQDEYLEKSGLPKWSGGGVDYSKRIMYTFPWSDKFLNIVLPHELTHIIFREYVKGNKKIPLWLDEGIAQYQERKGIGQTEKILRHAVRNNAYMPLEEFNQVYSLGDEHETGIVRIFYAQSESIVRFMIKKYGSQKFGQFVKQLKAGKTVEDALKFSYPQSIDSLDNLEKKWLEYMN
ncbi:hypothetical protein J7L67_01045 [bacterium]|nr:hypothetical protein [bacterium]